MKYLIVYQVSYFGEFTAIMNDIVTISKLTQNEIEQIKTNLGNGYTVIIHNIIKLEE